MTCDREALSAYVDRELSPEARAQVEGHLRECADCAAVLESYRRLRTEVLRSGSERAPGSLGRAVEDRVLARQRRGSLRWLPIALGAPVGLVAVMAGVAMLAPQPRAVSDLLLTATYPAQGAAEVAAGEVMEFWFDRALRPDLAAGAVAISPPIPARIEARGNALRIEPLAALEPGQVYSVSVDAVADVDGRSLKSPAVLTFTTSTVVAQTPRDGDGSRLPRDRAARQVNRSAQAVGSDQPVGETQDGPLGSPRTSDTVVAAAAGPAVRTLAQAGGLESLVPVRAQTPKMPGVRAPAPAASSSIQRQLDNPSVLERLGSPSGPAQALRLSEQAFQGGLMLRAAEAGQIYVLQRGRSRWQAYADTWRPEDPSVGSQAGLPPPPGALMPARAFGKLWSERAEVRSALGWAVYEPRELAASMQRCEGGSALQVGRLVYLLSNDQTWKALPLPSS